LRKLLSRKTRSKSTRQKCRDRPRQKCRDDPDKNVGLMATKMSPKVDQENKNHLIEAVIALRFALRRRSIMCKNQKFFFSSQGGLNRKIENEFFIFEKTILKKRRRSGERRRFAANLTSQCAGLTLTNRCRAAVLDGRRYTPLMKKLRGKENLKLRSPCLSREARTGWKSEQR
jgi:hypothetical protein